ncbi:hypothetical protein COEREDRAFT_86327 [Coemansia reversa NRRL 1564]|uniref:SCP domain-containing protein n=1 Tax=Coemansia reversa (strain ATCC 12441 / NRRL 1564) TaxID=763665 RepID=A0A2G5BE87_COERN|nr:hypothetical protein COEREDRAFT_86327 [Coemansia reversa NRRL 1564]|eukprot:PIA17336.1 hypothetical protein COEREDRAFT_86327 [Coemansia reversa NRRL 1564]
MKLTGIASLFTFAITATQAAPAVHTVTIYVEPKTVTVYQKANAGIDWPRFSGIFGGSHHGRPTSASDEIESSSTLETEEYSTDDSAESANKNPFTNIFPDFHKPSHNDKQSATEEMSPKETGLNESESPQPEETEVKGSNAAEPAESSDAESSEGSGPESSDWVTQMVCAINKVRSSHSLEPLGISSELNDIAEKHSEYQNSIGQMTHDNPSGGVGERLTALGINWINAAENVAAGMTSAEEAQQKLEESPGHLENMINSGMFYVGVGRSNNYYTQDFYGAGSKANAGDIPQCN